MIHVIAAITIKPGQRAAFLERFKNNVPNVLAEEGCVEYAPAVDVDSGIDVQTKDANVVTVIEKWETLAALRAHLAAPHMARYREDTADLTEGLTLSVLEDA